MATTVEQRPFIAELVGAAGAGKSVLSQALARRPEVMRASVWKLPRGWWLYNAVRSLPTLMGLCVRTRALPWADMRYMIRLRTLHHMLTRRKARRAPFVVLDEGPVFALAWLQLFCDPSVGGGAAMPRWRRRTACAWSSSRATAREWIARSTGCVHCCAGMPMATEAPPRPLPAAPARPRPAANLTQRASLNVAASLLDYGAKIAVNFVVIPILVTGLGRSLYGTWEMLGRLVGYLTA